MVKPSSVSEKIVVNVNNNNIFNSNNKNNKNISFNTTPQNTKEADMISWKKSISAFKKYKGKRDNNK